MKIALLTRNPKLFSHRRLMETAAGRGHEIVPIDYLRCYMNITSKRPTREARLTRLALDASDSAKHGFNPM